MNNFIYALRSSNYNNQSSDKQLSQKVKTGICKFQDLTNRILIWLYIKGCFSNIFFFLNNRKKVMPIGE